MDLRSEEANSRSMRPVTFRWAGAVMDKDTGALEKNTKFVGTLI